MKQETLIPWLGFYALLVPFMVGCTIANTILQEKTENKLYSIIPASLALIYIGIWVSVLRLYKTNQHRKNVILKGFGDIILEPLRSRVEAYIDENATDKEAKTGGEEIQDIDHHQMHDAGGVKLQSLNLTP